MGEAAEALRAAADLGAVAAAGQRLTQSQLVRDWCQVCVFAVATGHAWMMILEAQAGQHAHFKLHIAALFEMKSSLRLPP